MLNTEISTTDVIDGFIMHHEGTMRLFHYGIGGKNEVGAQLKRETL